MKLITAILSSILFFSLMSISHAAVVEYDVRDWKDFCDELEGIDLKRKHDALKLDYYYEDIRNDFIRNYNELILDQIRANYLWRASKKNKRYKQLVKDKKIGVWHKRHRLFLANSLVGKDFYPQWVDYYRQYLIERKDIGKISDFDYCIFETINRLFKDLTILGDNQKTKIKLKYNIKSK